MEFINAKHKERFEEIMRRGDISPNDKERSIGMYVISGNEYLYKQIEDLYDFQERWFKVDLVEDENGNTKIKFESDYLSSSEKAMMTFVFDVYSGRNNIGINELFSSLDIQNRQLILNAMKYRYI